MSDDRLGDQYGQTFADRWDFVDYAHKHNLKLDLTSPTGPGWHADEPLAAREANAE